MPVGHRHVRCCMALDPFHDRRQNVLKRRAFNSPKHDEFNRQGGCPFTPSSCFARSAAVKISLFIFRGAQFQDLSRKSTVGHTKLTAVFHGRRPLVSVRTR